MIRIEPPSLGGLTVIPGSTCVGGEITPLELLSFRLRLSESRCEASSFDGPLLAWDASAEFVAMDNRPRSVTRVSATQRDENVRLFCGRPIDMASLFRLFVSLATQRQLRRNVPSQSLFDALPVSHLRQIVALAFIDLTSDR
jgi:hypothetical protein